MLLGTWTGGIRLVLQETGDGGFALMAHMPGHGVYLRKIDRKKGVVACVKLIKLVSQLSK